MRGIVEDIRTDEDIELDPVDLGLDYDFEDEDLVISDEEMVDALQRIFVFSLAAFFEADTGEELILDSDGGLEDVLNELVIAMFRVQLEEILEIEVNDLETELDGDADQVIAAVFEELGILQSDVDDPTQDELRIAIRELDQIGDIVTEFGSDFGSGPRISSLSGASMKFWRRPISCRPQGGRRSFGRLGPCQTPAFLVGVRTGYRLESAHDLPQAKSARRAGHARQRWSHRHRHLWHPDCDADLPDGGNPNRRRRRARSGQGPISVRARRSCPRAGR